MTLEVPKQRRGRPKKVPDNKEEIDQAIEVWISPEPTVETDSWKDIREVAELVLILALIAFISVATVYQAVRI